jgi:16S rRNA (uracil1498-N3)-methyltransferase
MIRLWVNQPLGSGSSVLSDARQAHYLAHVMRMKEGDSIHLFNGKDGEWASRISKIKKSGASFECEKQLRPQPQDGHLRLFFAPIKRGHGDMVIEKATELGVTHLSPILTRHTIVSRVPVERYQAIAIEAAEQCERLSVPQIDAPLKLQDALAMLENDTRLILCAEQGKAEPLAAVAAQFAGQSIAILVGPEGGFDPEEFAFLLKQPNITAAHLGPRILRADTAAIAALSIVQSAAGDWREYKRG